MKEKITQLIDVKSIVTIILTTVFSHQVIEGVVSSDQLQTVFVTVLSFYFGVQFSKNKEDK